MNPWRRSLLVLRHNDRLRQALEGAALLSGIVGVGIGQLAPQYPFLFWAGLTVLLVAFVLDRVNVGIPNRYDDKKQIDEVWQHILAGAADEVCLVAGDCSWADRDAEVISSKVTAGVTVRVLSHPPRHAQTRRNVGTLLRAGAHVRCYAPSVQQHPHGIIVDPRSLESATVLRLKRTAVNEVPTGRDGEPSRQLYNYRAVRFVPERDYEDIATFTAMFDALWENATDALVLEQLETTKSALSIVLKALQRIPQYAALRAGNLGLRRVAVPDLMASCLYVKLDKLKHVERFVREFLLQGLSPFSLAICQTMRHRSIVLPPICEEHDERLVVVDGTHRLFNLHAVLNERDATVLVVRGNLAPAPR